jgi:hypothetical protein
MTEQTIEDLYPGLTNEERKVAAENLDRYLELAWEIFEDVQARERDGLTGAGSSHTIQGKVDSSIN